MATKAKSAVLVDKRRIEIQEFSPSRDTRRTMGSCVWRLREYAGRTFRCTRARNSSELHRR